MHLAYCWYGNRIRCEARIALAVCEDFTDRYANIAISGLVYDMFVPPTRYHPAYRVNVPIYSCMLLRTQMPYEWRGPYNEDADYFLQVLRGGWCTARLNVFCCKKVQTMTMRGGNTDILYRQDGRTKMAISLAERWPGIVSVHRRYGRMQHTIERSHAMFKQQLVLHDGVNLNNIPPNDYGLVLLYDDARRRQEVFDNQ